MFDDLETKFSFLSLQVTDYSHILYLQDSTFWQYCLIMMISLKLHDKYNDSICLEQKTQICHK